MSEHNEYYAYFTIANSFDPDEITRRVGISPTDSWRKGDIHPKTGHARNFSRWSLRSRLETTASLETHVRDVLDQLDANPAAFKQLCIEKSGTMQLVAYFRTDYPGLDFERELIERIAGYSLSMDCDFYYPYSDSREETE